MLSFYRKYYKTVFDIALLALTVYLFMLLFSYLWKIATPIFVALIIFAIINPLSQFLGRRGVKQSVASAISVMVFVLVILAVLTGLGVIVTNQVLTLKELIPQYLLLLQEQINNHSPDFQNRFEALPEDLKLQIRDYTAGLTGNISKIATNLLGSIATFLSGFSGTIITFAVNLVVGIVLAYFLSTEIVFWKREAKEHTPNTFKTAFYFLKENVLKGIVGYIKAQLKLISVTFSLILIGLLILGVNNALTLALLSALFDILPLLGVPVIFLPWIVYLLIVGQVKLGIALTILLAVTMITRQFLEPKITGDTLGVSAFTMLSFMIISLSLFGVSGLILAPILIILIKALHEQGYLKRWIRLPEEEYTDTTEYK